MKFTGKPLILLSDFSHSFCPNPHSFFHSVSDDFHSFRSESLFTYFSLIFKWMEQWISHILSHCVAGPQTMWKVVWISLTLYWNPLSLFVSVTSPHNLQICISHQQRCHFMVLPKTRNCHSLDCPGRICSCYSCSERSYMVVLSHQWSFLFPWWSHHSMMWQSICYCAYKGRCPSHSHKAYRHSLPLHRSFIRYTMQEGKIKIVYCPMNDNVTDTLMKPMPSMKAKHFAAALGLCTLWGGVLSEQYWLTTCTDQQT